MSPEETATLDALLARQDEREGRTPGAPSPQPWRFVRGRGELRGRIADARGITVASGVRPADALRLLTLAGDEALTFLIVAVATACRTQRDRARAAGRTDDADEFAAAYACVLGLRRDEVLTALRRVVSDGNG